MATWKIYRARVMFSPRSNEKNMWASSDRFPNGSQYAATTVGGGGYAARRKQRGDLNGMTVIMVHESKPVSHLIRFMQSRAACLVISHYS